MIRTLHIDIEGGWGGSSRSLYELLSRLDRSRIEPLVLHRQAGPIVPLYNALGIGTIRVPEIVTYVPHRGIGGRLLIEKLPQLLRIGVAARRIVDAAVAHKADVIHLNYEGLFLLGAMVRRISHLPIIMHSRASSVPPSIYSRWMCRTMTRISGHILFISPNEQEFYHHLQPASDVPQEIMWNIARPPLPRTGLGNPPEAVYLGNLDPSKGPQRLIDIAEALNQLNAPPLRLVIYGEARNKQGFRRFIEGEIERRGLHGRLRLGGFTRDVDKVLASAFALIRPSPLNDPWGRDVIEASAAGVPCLATGSFDGVIQNGVSGYLFPVYDAALMAGKLASLASDPEEWRGLSAAAARIGAERFGGERQARRFEEIATRLAGRAPQAAAA